MDGDQVLDFYWIDPIDAAKRFISKRKFAGKLYTQFKLENSTQLPGKQAFGRANSGLVFQACQAVDLFSSPLLLLFYADKSFSGKHRDRFLVRLDQALPARWAAAKALAVSRGHEQPTRADLKDAWRGV